MRLRLLGCNGRSYHVNPLIRVRVNTIREPIACISDLIDQPKGLNLLYFPSLFAIAIPSR
jgi:hypothetical protein